MLVIGIASNRYVFSVRKRAANRYNPNSAHRRFLFPRVCRRYEIGLECAEGKTNLINPC